MIYFRCLNRSNQCSKLEKYILFGNETSAQVTVKQGSCFNLSVIFHFNYKQMKVQHTHLMLDKWWLTLIYVWDLETKPPKFIFIKMRGDLSTISKHKRTEDHGGPELKYVASYTILCLGFYLRHSYHIDMHNMLKYICYLSSVNCYSSPVSMLKAMWAPGVQHLYCNMFINLSARWKNGDVIINSASLLSRRMQLLIKEEVGRPAGIKWAFHLTEGSAAVGLTWALSVHLLNPMTGNWGIITTFPSSGIILKYSILKDKSQKM